MEILLKTSKITTEYRDSSETKKILSLSSPVSILISAESRLIIILKLLSTIVRGQDQ